MEYDDAGKIVFSDKELEEHDVWFTSKVEDRLDELVGMIKPDMPKGTVNALVHATALEITELKNEELLR